MVVAASSAGLTDATGTVAFRDTSSRGPSDAVNLLLAGALSGFGPYVASVFSPSKIGPNRTSVALVPTVAGFAGLLAQLPGGQLLGCHPIEANSGRTMCHHGCSRRNLVISILGRVSRWCWPPPACSKRSPGGFLGWRSRPSALASSATPPSWRTTRTHPALRIDWEVIAAGLMGLVGHFPSYRAIPRGRGTRCCRPLRSAASSLFRTSYFGRACGVPDHRGPSAPPRARHRETPETAAR